MHHWIGAVRGNDHADCGDASASVGRTLAGEGLLSMLRGGLESDEQRARRWPAIVILLLAWLGFVGISGTHLDGLWRAPLFGVLPRPVLFWGAFGASIVAAMLAAVRRHRALSLLAVMVACYLLGNLFSAGAHHLLQPRVAIESAVFGYATSRLLYAACVATPMLVVYAVGFRRRGEFHLRVGSWRGMTRLAKADPPRTWAATLLRFTGIAAAMFVVMQWMVGFGPVLSGRLPALLLPIVLMALTNAFAEELVFRGLLQGAAIDAVGASWGMWTVALVFGIHHFGASFDVLTSLPGALLLGVGSVLFAKSVVETRGLAWAICAHAMIDVGLFAAFYVAS